MTGAGRHFGEELQGLLDRRLDEAGRAAVEAHLAGCESCRLDLEALRWTKETLRRLDPLPLPDGLEARVSAALDGEDRPRSGSPALLVGRGLRWGLLAAASLAVAGLAYLLTGRPSPPDWPAAVAYDYRDYRAHALPLELRTESVKEMEAFFAKKGLPFSARVLDLGMMNYRLVGGRVHRLAGRPSALLVYRTEGGKVVVCRMYLGRTAELPARAVLREHGGIRFHVYQSGGLTTAFWQEGPVICALTSDIDAEELVRLAFEKAMKV